MDSLWSSLQLAVALGVLFIATRYGNPWLRREMAGNPPTPLHRTLVIVGIAIMFISPVAALFATDGRLFFGYVLGLALVVAAFVLWRQAGRRRGQPATPA